ncbi:unnamed protein product, partial [Rotaria socialis]
QMDKRSNSASNLLEKFSNSSLHDDDDDDGDNDSILPSKEKNYWLFENSEIEFI